MDRNKRLLALTNSNLLAGQFYSFLGWESIQYPRDVRVLGSTIYIPCRGRSYWAGQPPPSLTCPSAVVTGELTGSGMTSLPLCAGAVLWRSEAGEFPRVEYVGWNLELLSPCCCCRVLWGKQVTTEFHVNLWWRQNRLVPLGGGRTGLFHLVEVELACSICEQVVDLKPACITYEHVEAQSCSTCSYLLVKYGRGVPHW